MDELKKIAPKLSKIKKENPYRTPDNYFDDFSARLQMKIEAEKQSPPEKQNKVIRLLKPVIGLAASFILIFMLVYWPINRFMNEQVAENETEEIMLSDEFYTTLLSSLDAGSFYGLLDETEEDEVGFTDEEFNTYISNNISAYEIFLETEY